MSLRLGVKTCEPAEDQNDGEGRNAADDRPILAAVGPDDWPTIASALRDKTSGAVVDAKEAFIVPLMSGEKF